MQLKEFRVQNYRSVNDSGPIEVRQRTALVGRNESGKTNLLQALQSLNPAGRKLAPLTMVKDFPRDRHRGEFSEDLSVVNTTWLLSESEQRALTKIFPRANGVTEVTVARTYKPVRPVGFVGLRDLSVDHEVVAAGLASVERSIGASLRGKEPAKTDPLKAALQECVEEVTPGSEAPTAWWQKGIDRDPNVSASCRCREYRVACRDGRASRCDREDGERCGDRRPSTRECSEVGDRTTARVHLPRGLSGT